MADYKVISLKKPQNKVEAKNQENNECKRSGTSGVEGQLYETKLLGLILLRAISDDNIKEFVLGTNIEGVGALDDVILRYRTNGSPKSKIIFIQAKHRNDPTKDKLTVDDLLKEKGDFSLVKYLESYLNIKRKFLTHNHTMMFKGPMQDLEYEFVIYTSAMENFIKKETLQHHESLIKSNADGMVFQFKYDDGDIERLMINIRKSRVINLAKTLAKIIKKDNFNNVMTNDLIKTYHVFLAQYVITAKSLESLSSERIKDLYCIGSFQESFLTSRDDNFLLMKRELYKEIFAVNENKLAQGQNDVASELRSIRFKLPVSFGNREFSFKGNEIKQERRLIYLCNIFKKLLHNENNEDSKYIYVMLDDYSVRAHGLTQIKDSEIYSLRGLVGNLLIKDDETKMFKFNLNILSLSNDNIKVIEKIQEQHFNLSKVRFNINMYGFPQLTIDCTEHDRKLVIDFLDNLKFYTNQAKEDEVEVFSKKEIDRFLNLKPQQLNTLFGVKRNEIYLKFHDYIQKWWKQPSPSYLTKTCQFYQQAEREILGSPLVNINNHIYREEVKNIPLQFNIEAVKSLELDKFLNSDEKVWTISTNEINFSSIKLIQYFDEKKSYEDSIIIDLGGVISKHCLDSLKEELSYSESPVLIVISQNRENITQLEILFKLFEGKIIIIICSDLENDFKSLFPHNTIIRDTKNHFSNLSVNTRTVILDERKVIFQGVQVIVNTVFNDAALEILSPQLLSNIIYNGHVELGQSLINSVFWKTSDYFVDRWLCRCVTLDTDKYKDTFTYLTDELNGILLKQQSNDIVIITDSENKFKEFCRSSKSNVHWFLKRNEHPKIVWKQSHGSLDNLFECVEKDSHKEFMLPTQTLKDVHEKVVIISAAPGMGKSTLLNHLAVNTKKLYPQLWIISINLRDKIDQLSQWKDDKAEIGLMEVIKFLYSSIINAGESKYSAFMSWISKLMYVNNNDIYFYDLENLHDVDFSEIKLLNYFYNNESLAVLFDGFDEICNDYTNEVVQLLRTLKSSKVAHLWVTSRSYNMQSQLELALGTFSFGLNLWTPSEQKIFLYNLWSKKFNLHRATYSSVEKFYNEFIEYRYSIGNEFTSLPLHLYMIAEVFKNNYVCGLDGSMTLGEIKDNLNLVTLYDKFMNIKFDIRFGEKFPKLYSKDPQFKKMISITRKLFIKNHKKTAAYLLLDKNLVLTDDETKEVQEFIEATKFGDEMSDIIEYISDEYPKFVHYTFAEYFAVEHLFNKLILDNLSNTPIWKYFTDEILTNVQRGIRRFVNSKLQTNKSFLLELNYKQMRTVTDTLLSQHNLQVNALYVAIEERFESISIFILQCLEQTVSRGDMSLFIKLVTKTCNMFCCVFCAAIFSRNQVVVKSIVRIVKNIDINKLKDLFYCEDGFKFNPLLLAVEDKQIFHIACDALNDHALLVDLFTTQLKGIIPTAAHYLGRHGHLIKFCLEYLKTLSAKHLETIFSVKDFEDRIPFHYAAIENNYEFFSIMESVLDRETFKKMCTTADYRGFTPICCFPYHKMYFEKYKKLLVSIYENPYIDVEDFVIYKLPKLHPKKNWRMFQIDILS